jgi:Htaa
MPSLDPALRRRLVTVLAALAALIPVLITAPARGDDPLVPIAAGAGLDWGVKQSFRNYIEGGIAAGTITVSDGATRNGDGTFHFPLRDGTFDPDTNATIVQFDGTVHMEGHDGALEMTVANPRVELTPTQARLIADVTSLPLNGGPMATYPAVQFASLALAGVDPVVDLGAGTTTWSAIPAFLSAPAVPAFANHYSVGGAIDPVSFSYAGPGGRPLPPLESWASPGVAVFGTVASTTLAGVAVGSLVPDPANGVVHAVGRGTGGSNPTAYRALDASTLRTVDALDDPTVTWSQDAQLTTTQRTALEAGTLYTASLAGPLQRTRFQGGRYVQDGTFGTAITPAPTHIAAGPGATRLYVSIGGLRPSARLYTRSGADWTEQARAFDASRGLTSDLAVDPDGTVLETHRAGTPSTRPIAILDYDVDPLGRTAVADTLPTTGNGLALLALAPGGVLYGAEQDAPISRLQRVVKGTSGYAADGGLLSLDVRARDIDADADGTLWVGAQGSGTRHPLLAVRDGAIAGTVVLPGSADEVAAADGTAYVSNLNGSVWAVRQLGVTPSVTDQPDDASIALAAGETTGEATFTAAATGTPAPSVRWQSRAPGSSTFTDLAGETSGTLTLDVSVADDGTEYRAVFANETVEATPQPVGELATDPATLRVRAAPSLAVQPADVAAIEGDPALLKALPAGNPAPAVQWQRLEGGAWTNVPGATDLFLSIPDTTLAMDGTQYRVQVANAVGSATSQPATLSVTPRLPPSVTFGSGHLDWGVKASFRAYIEGPIAHGSYAASDGAVRNPDGTIRFELVGGTYATATRSGELQLRGTVRFSGHDAPGGPQLDLTLRDPRLVLAGDAGTLYANATSKALGSGALQQFPDVALASVDLAGTFPAPLLDGLAFSALPAALTPAGVPVFAQYAAGVAMDPLTIDARYGTPRSLPRADPPAPPAAEIDPPTPPVSQAVAARAGTALVGGDGRTTTTIAIVTCRRGPCRVTVPRRAYVHIGDRTFRAVVFAPRSLMSGRRGHVRVRLTRRAAARLGCRHGTIRLRIAVVGTDGRTSELVAVTVQRPAARC